MTRSYKGPIYTKLAATIFNWVCKIQFHGLTIQNRSYSLKHVTQELPAHSIQTDTYMYNYIALYQLKVDVGMLNVHCET